MLPVGHNSKVQPHNQLQAGEIVYVLLICQNADLTSSAGYDAIIQYMNDGKRTCKEVEDFMKAR